MFIMLGKRRRTTSSTSSSSSSSSASRHGGGGPGRLSRVPGTPAAPPRRSPMAEAANNLFTTWLPGSPSRRKMGNSSSAMAAGQPQKKSTGTTPPVSRGGSFKAGALGSWWPGGGGGGGSGDDQDIEGLAESRRVEKREVSTAGSTDSRTGLRESFNGLGQHKCSLFHTQCVLLVEFLSSHCRPLPLRRPTKAFLLRHTHTHTHIFHHFALHMWAWAIVTISFLNEARRRRGGLYLSVCTSRREAAFRALQMRRRISLPSLAVGVMT
ncbi:hypothetical protein VTK73DRAFT_5795 [Phialemonium thermophilum]|uniref:Uncharacterized protein n=1 Tax=Phialemonium thermophilum TaxID=223376 RepID=A0ABR3V0H0_9PEZI